MSEPVAIIADFIHAQPEKKSNYVTLCFNIEKSQLPHALKVLGYPELGKNCFCAIARYQTPKGNEE